MTNRPIDLTILEGTSISSSIETYALLAEAVSSQIRHLVTQHNPESGGRRPCDVTTVDIAELADLTSRLQRFTDNVVENVSEAQRRTRRWA